MAAPVLASRSRHLDPLLAALDAQHLELPPRPELAAQLLQATTDPSAGSHQLTRLVEGDPALTARVIQLANTSRWRGRRRIDALSRAVARLGVRVLRETVLALDLSRVYRAPGHERLGIDIWHHALATALYAREISACTGQHGELAYTCGLLHSMGSAAALHQAAQLCRTRGWTISADEMADVVELHAELAGAMLARDWDLPDAVRATITWVHIPGTALRHRSLVNTVALAAQLALNITQRGSMQSAPIGPIVQRLGLSEADLEHLQEAEETVRDGLGALTR